MATVNAATLDAAKHTLFYRENAMSVVVPLPFTIITIDEDFQGYQPTSSLGLVNEKGVRRTGRNMEQVTLTRNMPLPRAAGNDNQDEFAVWFYNGI
jgi:hypothetical protein